MADEDEVAHKVLGCLILVLAPEYFHLRHYDKHERSYSLEGLCEGEVETEGKQREAQTYVVVISQI